ncbi:unnamed protein product [Gemmataceae bacterium]|nr:unnamed protein product [Gemmataceae bacterium]VTT98054.1 unnamed protein product [Gemmataceae bacterium]
MFTLIWDTLAFDQMQAIVLWNPARRAEIAAALSALDRELHTRADTWGESRDPPFRLGYSGALSALVRVDTQDRVAEIAEVRLGPASTT